MHSSILMATLRSEPGSRRAAYVAANGPPPTITGFTRRAGRQGTAVTITGTNFTGATAVSFNGASATFTVASAAQISTTVPAGAGSAPDHGRDAGRDRERRWRADLVREM